MALHGVKPAGGLDLIAELKEDELLKTNKEVMFGLEQMELVLKYCEILGVSDKVSVAKTAFCAVCAFARMNFVPQK